MLTEEGQVFGKTLTFLPADQCVAFCVNTVRNESPAYPEKIHELPTVKSPEPLPLYIRPVIHYLPMNVKLTDTQKITVTTSSDIARIMQQILARENKIGRAQEHFWVVGLDNSNKILFIELIGLGRQNRVHANPPDVFRMAIYKLAIRIFLVHNHPNGVTKPSKADHEMTDRMIKVGEIINVEVLDHLVISETTYTSFNDLGIMDQLRASDTWRIVEKESEEIKQIRLDMEKASAKREAKLDVARAMKAEGLSEEMIKKLTGLRVGEIRKL